MTRGLAETLATFLAAGIDVARVVVADARGSTPREAGAAMLVTVDQTEGTIGGGRFEWDAIAVARELLASGGSHRTLEIPLGPAIGQCCGGHVTLTIARADAQTLAAMITSEAAERASRPQILIFGAGFVGRALASALAPLPFHVRLIDNRAAEFAGFDARGIVQVVTDRTLTEVEAAPTDAAYLVMTHSHALDALIAGAVLERGDFRYLGIIGSRTKRKRFEAAFRQQGIDARDIARITCPIGSPSVRDKRPAVIAALAAAELITIFAADVTAQTDASRRVA
ncbi:xanthine dehydrogenase accessory protein XdhC [Bradyrhizobium sp. U87765 SZCCT0131]|uniref:xanthine dehydrogenase accessory protein XdhC n=1 Tax=unclassified Bradyrhizobium TaxID=2631580 RepID=UPI001BAAB337|nr:MULTISPECIES: xanthine dehydrogenase accessory protein XdhC [unclassified Bradyrhizobium]MBR1221728.1 xanthine dehydrogenase accessory protein XdhC [Bradyrhizobium sp. U87765 SZCCT0131]MBR1264349.1 xanthine dehydrogenase accessory protein XdhC [Bradyrhizobium sp. U87765 SZCCT0134]MBR1304744.1 xanthine dehydrogenase accessory protein XdhC [Bradyrhizobium sp. U87765 SZCCT0110]MBR1322399.1 xanthine dehydrogenase accessory protein XdhC [Bradyrhizobium sp. U87765 SZCCT0109]MBR1346673.1 xanthine 